MYATGKKYKYAMVYSFTKFIWLFPTKTTSCEETLKKFRIWSEIFGNPVRIVSHRGSAFTANSFVEHMKENGIEPVWSTTGVPRGNGQIERVNRTVLSINIYYNNKRQVRVFLILHTCTLIYGIILGGNAYSHHTQWGSTNTNERGE